LTSCETEWRYACFILRSTTRSDRLAGRSSLISSRASSGGILAQPNSPDMTPDVAAIVIAAGVVGLAGARALSLSAAGAEGQIELR
jgi:hypothetical protein